jgi:4-hydroxymandelate oxidase
MTSSDPESLVDLLLRYERTAAEVLPSAAYDFIAEGAGEEISSREAVAAWRAYRLRPHVLRDVSHVDTSTSVLGVRLSAPVLIAPTAFHVMSNAQGEVETARGVRAAASLMVVPTLSSMPLEAVAAALSGPWWLQVYCTRERELTRRLVADAARLGASAVVLTGDTPLVARKRRVIFPPVTADQYLTNFRRYLARDAEYAFATSVDPSIGVEIVTWLREESGLPVVVKGILRGDDAKACIEAGAEGLIVSNHGGRQLDRALPTAAALADVVDAVGDSCEVLVDGGIRSGIDVLIALALGARAVLLGRPVQWALAAEGASGVERVLRTIRDEFFQAMALAGASSTSQIDRSLLSAAFKP